ncbi:MAG: hypothetical protein EPN69_09940 [Rhodanobacter sp.]|nr:MAG: hypothetical protein EPN69_09940 [Rhodanobacter sp.]TAM39383.1 MAG: hypothetical protein EPN58_13665 [Rhodanobacter sp.]TAN26988.1 MAG: hypothetical protein EPN32_05550 [Rhodanobacter sp.]
MIQTPAGRSYGNPCPRDRKYRLHRRDRQRSHARRGRTGISEHHVRQAVQLSADKYCSASIMLGKAAAMSHDYEILEQDGPWSSIPAPMAEKSISG